MSIFKIDGKLKDEKGRKGEEEFDIMVRARKIKEIGVQVHVEITPLFCMKCNNQLDGFFKHDGSRYGFVGTVQCNNCGETINCSDHDNFVHELITSSAGQKLELNYYQLYKLDNTTWSKIKQTTGYDLQQIYSNEEWVPLKFVLDEICSLCDINIDDLPPYTYNTSNKIKRFPYIINKWFSLLHYLTIDC